MGLESLVFTSPPEVFTGGKVGSGASTGFSLGNFSSRWPVVCDRFTVQESGDMSSSSTSCSI